MVVCALLPIDRHCKHLTCLQWLYTNRGGGGCGKPGVCPELRRLAIDGQPQGRYLVCVPPGRHIRPGQGEVHIIATRALHRCVCMALPVIASRSSHSIDGCMPVHSHPCIRVYMIPPNCCTRAYTCRCSGDFTQAKQTKYAQALPGLSSRAISKYTPADLTEAEQAVAEQPGMYGRIWYGQGLCFDEAYQILQDRGVYTHTYHHRSIAYCIGVHRICTSPGAHTSSVAYHSNHTAASCITFASICLCTHQCCRL